MYKINKLELSVLYLVDTELYTKIVNKGELK